MQQEEKNKINQLSPAFPPQVAQDSLGRIFAAIPGMTKLEFFAIMMYPTESQRYKNFMLMSNEDIMKVVTENAKIFLNHINKQNEETSSNIIK